MEIHQLVVSIVEDDGKIVATQVDGCIQSDAELLAVAVKLVVDLRFRQGSNGHARQQDAQRPT